MGSNKNNYNKQDGEKLKSNDGPELAQANEPAIEEHTETVEEMELRIRLEVEEKAKKQMEDMKIASDEKLKEIEKNTEDRLKALESKPSSEPMKSSITSVDIEQMFKQMEAGNEATFQRLKSKDFKEVIDDTAARQQRSEKTSVNANKKFAPNAGTAQFMMRQNLRYKLESKPEPYTAETVKNTLSIQLGLK